MAYGTAPRKVGGVWVTRSGRRLSNAGQAYWTKLHNQGRTDGFGHMTQHATVTQASAPVKKPGFDTYVKVKRGDKQAIAQVKLYNKSKQAKAEATQTRESLQAAKGYDQPVFRKASKVVNPVAGAVIEAVSPSTSLKEAGKALKKGNVPAAALAASGVFPVGKGARLATGIERGIKAEKAAAAGEAALAGRRVVKAGEKVQQLQGARSRITRNLIEKPADKASQAMMGEGKIAKAARKMLPTASAEMRVAKYAGRETRFEGERAQARMVGHIKALPKEGSSKDVAHFWWAQLPKSHRNVEGLKAIRAQQVNELTRIESGAKQAALGKKKIAIAGLPKQAEDLRLAIASLDKVIANPPKVDEKVIGAIHALSGDRQKVLQESGLLTPERAAARRGIVSQFVGAQPTGEEAFIGHRLGRVRGQGQNILPVSMGVGKARTPEGLGKANKLVRVKTGAVRTSTHVAAEDWQASQTYRHAVRARDDLGKIGKPFDGRFNPKTEMLVNPKGRAVPAEWKTDKLAQLVAEGHDEAQIKKAAEEITGGFIAKPGQEQDFIKAARAAGVDWPELRVVPKKTVERYYNQFTPAHVGSTAGKVYDRAIDAVAANIIFARVGYVPKNIAQNVIMAVPHQGAFLPTNVARAGAVLRDADLRHLISSEVGQGATGAVAQEAASKVLSKPAHLVSGVADTPLRISAFLHEAAAEGIISKINPHLTDKDRAALTHLMTDPGMRPVLNDIRQRSVEAMADFSRMTPKQRKMARRFLVIPGWLMAGSRYPIHFAATHPIRSAALAYVGAGEPGSPHKFNKPVNEYFAKGLPSYVSGINIGGKVARFNSLSPVSTPWEGAGALVGKSPQTAGDYANPLLSSLWNTVHRQVETSSGDTRRVGYGEAAKANLFERLTPSVQFIKDEISPPSGDNRLYPDTSRLGRLARESGVVPVKIGKDAAQRARFRERGMNRSAGTVSDKVELYDRLKAAGEKPSHILDAAYAIRLERQQRLDKLFPAMSKVDEQKAYKSDVELLVEHGLLTEKEAADTLAAAKGASDDQLKSWRAWFGRHKFGGETIGDVKHWLHQQGK